MRISTIVPVLFALLIACSKPPSNPPDNPPSTSSDPAVDPGADAGADAGADEGGGDRPGITAADCEAQGGTVVGDIGDGAIHQPDYVCPESGVGPIGSIVPEGDSPTPVEGAVCCK